MNNNYSKNVLCVTSAYPLRSLPQFAFETPEPEKSVVDVKLEEKIGKRNLAIIQDEETFRIFGKIIILKTKDDHFIKFL